MKDGEVMILVTGVFLAGLCLGIELGRSLYKERIARQAEAETLARYGLCGDETRK